MAWPKTQSPGPDAHPPSKPKQPLLPALSSPQNLVFWSRTPLFLVSDPLCDPFFPSLSASLCFYLGAVRAPSLRLLLKREHTQWSLSQPLSVSIKDPGNTTLTTEPILKGQRARSLRCNLSSSISHCFHEKKRNLCHKFTTASRLSKKHTRNQISESAETQAWCRSGPDIYLDCFGVFGLKLDVQTASLMYRLYNVEKHSHASLNSRKILDKITITGSIKYKPGFFCGKIKLLHFHVLIEGM